MRSLFSALGAYVLLLPFQAPQGSLRDDARVADVLDKQGTALVRPVGRERWTPLRQRDALLPGDQVRTPVRGANAVEIALKPAGRLVVGPGALVELSDRGKIKLYTGEVEVRGDKEKPVEVTGPGGFAERVADAAFLRVASDRTTKLPKAPRWLDGYRGSTSDEWLGSLIANVDGRNVPLHVGYHKVQVDVRDQIARTTVEESFVNSTNGTLEGVFYFPLPADASISGFGMWIGSELVEADIVERDKARAIYEDILRKRKDPGLLEWAGGNLFKARVFPIFPHSEKRIRIQYTQVLPLEGARLRYRYALRSELLRQHPLRELQIAVNVSSTQKIAAITSPTHAVRTRATAHAASAEFSAEEYAPTQDFELVIDVERGNPLTVVPHRRGEDGYFMLLLSPPDATQGGAWQRDLVPERGPLDLVLLCDTSGSMDRAARAAQAQLAAAVLAQLSAKDRFALAACDLGVNWWQPEAQPVSEDKAEAALAFLGARRSLGWTDLDRALGEVAKRAGPSTIVVYLGDGIGTTGDADPTAQAQRLQRLVAAAPGTFHCLTTGSTYEQGVLQAIAGKGGSLRAIGDDPARTAFELLREVAQPAVKDLRVSFEGLRTARVYPETLPNLAQGTQQVVLGRFLPQGSEGQAAQRGEVVVTGKLDGKEVRFRAELTLAQGEEGNSFLPRLWARRHLDALLALGSTTQVRDEIVAFSEEFGILTPLTSFLVLETDEDRATYGVQRRVHMRDGERFFADGAEQARTELRRQQMQVARTWRLDLRRQLLRELATLGEGLVEVAWGWGYGMAVGGKDLSRLAGAKGRYRDDYDVAGNIAAKSKSTESELDGREGLDKESANEEPAADPGHAADELRVDRQEFAESKREMAAKLHAPAVARPQAAMERSSEYGQVMQDRRSMLPPPQPPFGSRFFPALADAPVPQEWTPPKHWPAEAVAVLRSLDRRQKWLALAGLAVRTRTVARHALRGDETWAGDVEALLGSSGWFVRSTSPHGDAIDQWLSGQERGLLYAGLRLGRRRPAQEHDRADFPFPGPEYRLASFAGYATWELTVRGRDGDRVTLGLVAPAPQKSERVVVVDAQRAVVLEDRMLHDGRAGWTQRAEELVEVAGQTVAKKLVTLDEDGRVISVQALDVRSLAADAVATEIAQRVAGHDDVIFLGRSDPALADAKEAVAEGTAGFAEHLQVAGHLAASQQWDKAWEHWQAAAAKVAGRPGALWLRAELCAISRRGPELQALLQERAGELAKAKATPALATYALELAARVLAPHEQLELGDKLRPVFEPEGETFAAHRRAFVRARARLLEQAGRGAEARDAWRTLAEANPHDSEAILAWVNLLAPSDRDAAIAALRARLAAGPWTDGEVAPLYYRLSDLLFEQRDRAGLAEVLAAWTARGPRTEDAWLRWLSALMLAEQDEAADAWVLAELRAALPGKADYVARARRSAAVRFALGQGWNLSMQQVEPVFWKPLADLARAALLAGDAQFAWHTHDWRFRNTDEFAQLMTELRTDLTGEGKLETLPVEQIGQYLQFVSVARTEIDAKVWRGLVDRLRTRFERTSATSPAERAVRDALAQHVLHCLDGHGETSEALAFARQRLAATPAEDTSRPWIAQDLLQRLLASKWTEALEAEVFALVPQVQPFEIEDSLAGREARQAGAARTLRQVVKHLEALRYLALLGEPKDYEKLARADLRAKQLQSRRQARAALATALQAQSEKLGAWEKPWLAIERIALLARLGDDVKAVHAEALALFAATPEATSPDHILRERCAYVLAWCAAHRSAPKELSTATLDFLGERVTAAAKAIDSGTAVATDWRHHLVRLLVVLDRPQDLLELLGTWIIPAKVESRWRIARGYLLAELGRLDEAVKAFEATPQGELGAAEQKALADWLLDLDGYLPEGGRRRGAVDQQWAKMSEHELWMRVHQEAQRVQRHGDGVPAELDPEVLGALEALFAKAAHPPNYFWAVTQLYNAGKDFRVLACLCQALVGHTRHQVYPFLEQVGQVLQNVHQEATCDELVAAIAKLRGEVKLDLHRRALDLFAALVERRAGEVLNQPGPHLERGLAALRRGLAASFEVEEATLLASFLASLGRIPQSDYAKAQRAQLARLLDAAKPGSRERLVLAGHCYRTDWAYGDHDRAIDGLRVALDEVRAKDTRRLPADVLHLLQMVSGWLQERQRFALAEELLVAEIAAQETAQLKAMLRQQLFQVWIGALRQRGTVAFGRGEELYTTARKHVEESLWRDGADQVTATLQAFCQLHQTAQKNAGIKRAGQDLEAWATSSLRELATRGPGDYSLLQTVCSTLHDLRGPVPPLALAVDWIEREPRWLERSGQGAWRQMHWQLAQWRSEAKDIGALAPRLLAIVLRELERDLVTLQQNSIHSFCWQHSGHFWPEKREDFARVAGKVVELWPDSPSRQVAAASYFWNGLGLRERAVDVLLQAGARDKLREAGQWQLVSWLFELRRWGEALTWVDLVVVAVPDRVDYRTMRARILHELGRDGEARDWLAASAKLFREQGRWNEAEIAALAWCARQCGLHREAVVWFEEVIPLHQRTQPGRGIGNGTLSHYYGEIAQCYVALGEADKAVDAASAAVVSWGSTHSNRAQAIAALRSVLEGIKDLGAWAARHDARVKETGLDAPLLRKVAGLVWLERREAKKALVELRLARELQPDDAEVHAALVRACDALADAPGACASLFESIEAAPRNLDLYLDLGRRLEKLGDRAQAERAFTSLAEALPNEAESHQKLAEEREQQKRLGEAIVQWQQVVRCRKDEPPGWLSLARAQIAAGAHEEARRTLEHVVSAKWDPRFGDVKSEAARLLAQMSGSPR